MPRQNVYLNRKVLDGILKIVGERRDEGATAAEANISRVCSELLELGLRVYINAKSLKEDEGFSPELRMQWALMEEVIKSRLAVQQILRMMYDLQEIKGDSRNNYNKLIDWLKEQTELRLTAVFKEE